MKHMEMELSSVARLTEKQRECLHLVVQRKSSKEIARILKISKPAVDQRIDGARRTLGVESRNEAAIIFARASGGYDPIIYDPAHVPKITDLCTSADQGKQSFMLDCPTDVSNEMFSTVPNRGFRALRDPGRNLKPIHRIVIMMGMTMSILIMILMGLAIAQSLSHVLTN